MTTRTLHILSGGAALGLVRRLQPAFEARHGCRIEASFGAVGLMREKLLAGDVCDVLILADALIAQLGADGRVVAGSARPLGVVRTGLAIKEGAPEGSVASPAAMKAWLQRAGAVYVPDPEKSTAGIHFMKVLGALGLAEPLAMKLRTFPHGTAAMAALAQAPEADAVGCTQVTEILATPGVRLTGLLPAPYELATTYTAAVAANADDPLLARELVAALAAPEAAEERRACGIE